MRFASLLVKIPANWVELLPCSCNMSVRILECVPKDGAGGQNLLQTDTDQGLSQEELADRTRAVEPGWTVQLTTARPGRQLGAVEIERCATCRLMADSGCFMDSASSRDDGLMQWSIIATNARALRDLVEKVTDLGCTVDVESVSVLRTASELTMAQERVLQMAYELGYFEIPKRITLDKLAKRTEISKATLDVMLRRAQRKLVASHVGGVC